MTFEQTAVPASDERAPALQDEIMTPADNGVDDPDETVEVEYEGRTYQLPKALQGALMRQADYTRKTQDLAQARRHIAAAQQQAAGNGHAPLVGLARLHALDAALAPAGRIAWGALAAQNPGQAQFLQQYFQHLKAMRGACARGVLATQQQRSADAQRHRARQVEDGHARLKKEIEDWSPELQRRILATGKANEFSDSELHSVTDPRMIKVLNKARQFDEIQEKNAAAKRLTASQAAKPVREVGDKSPATSDPARMSTAEWMRWRAGNLRKRR